MDEVDEVTTPSRTIYSRIEEDKFAKRNHGLWRGICSKKRLHIVTKVITDTKNSQRLSRQEFAYLSKAKQQICFKLQIRSSYVLISKYPDLCNVSFRVSTNFTSERLLWALQKPSKPESSPSYKSDTC